MFRIRFKFAMENYGEEKKLERIQQKALHRFYKIDAENGVLSIGFFMLACKNAWTNSFCFLKDGAKRISV